MKNDICILGYPIHQLDATTVYLRYKTACSLNVCPEALGYWHCEHEERTLKITPKLVEKFSEQRTDDDSLIDVPFWIGGLAYQNANRWPYYFDGYEEMARTLKAALLEINGIPKER